MSFQKQVKANQALGNVGQISKAHHSFLNVIPAIAADDFVKVGSFVQSSSTATNENEVVGASGKQITGSILGVVVRDKIAPSLMKVAFLLRLACKLKKDNMFF